MVTGSEVFADGALAGRAVLITGGGTGLGRAAAAELRRCGADVVICGRRPEVLEATAAELDLAWVAGDVREDADAERRRSSRRAGAPSRASTSAPRSGWRGWRPRRRSARAGRWSTSRSRRTAASRAWRTPPPPARPSRATRARWP